ncbi:Triple functional domain protein [Frankliniella fusca]|uniref:Triple functional domain protein n=1 Tax=Frankliniella fusca TaxID=407009 RepID=A0AAE1LKH3_9NEOP|nr:Triple functional domain protein [Frankliniella fusca]
MGRSSAAKLSNSISSFLPLGNDLNGDHLADLKQILSMTRVKFSACIRACKIIKVQHQAATNGGATSVGSAPSGPGPSLPHNGAPPPSEPPGAGLHPPRSEASDNH